MQYRDPTEFRKRFALYKEGNNPYQNGLPKYELGKNSFSDDEAMDYILQLENPNRIGYSNGIWRPPTDSTKYDVHLIGGGLDMREEHNPIVYNFLKSKGRLNNPYLTEAEEKLLRMLTWRGKRALMDKFVAAHGDLISQLGYNTAAGMLWHGHPFKKMNQADSVTGKALLNALATGDKDLTGVFDAYYGYGDNAKRFASRINANTKYRKSYKPAIQPRIVKDSELVKLMKQQELFQPWSNYHATDYPLNNPAPSSVSSWNNAQGPSYTASGLATRRAYENIRGMLPLLEDDEWEPELKLPGLKNGKLPGYEDGNSPEIAQGAKIGTAPFVGFNFHTALKAARNFLQSYLLSEGFKERLKRTRSTQIAKFRGSDYDDSSFYNTGLLYDSKLGPFKLKKIVYKKNDSGWSNNGNYDWDHTITVGPHTNSDYDDTIAHELGHVLDNSFISNTGMPYSEMIPLLRNNKQYLQKLKQLLNDEDEWYIQLWKTDPMSFDYIMYHDAMPEESYGDVISTRYWLDKHGIFDSKKAGNIFTEDHYDQILKNKDKLPLTVRRFFDNFSKEDYIKIINDVAYNNTNKNDGMLYAKDGKSPIYIKPLNRGKLTRLKKRTGKSESELYNDGNPAHKKMVVFARNARKWKH